MNEDEHWERQTLRDIALEGVKERRRARRWGLVFKALILIYLFTLLFYSPVLDWLAGDDDGPGRHTAAVDVTGPIMTDSPASAETVIRSLERAFEAPEVAGVILRINSPGGSPVQSGRINDALKRLRESHPDIPVHAVAGDLMTSGAYYIAAGADRIFADKASLVGSIGVIMGGFGFTESLDKLGVERRLYTAGDNKAFLDPFSAEDEDQVAHAQEMLGEIHQQFIDVVRAGRGERLNREREEEIFSGLIWTGERGLALGLVDDLAGPQDVAREVIGAEEIIDYTVQPGLFERITDRLGIALGRELASRLGLGTPQLR
ncbi:S49 family peptidase [Spiribacter halobius]|uniref:S49 family peptidase n=1 Tax=Sediminicurvatus halobius TaxID=2182432 RepID=A0A2U2N2N0_9GAMM|nr:S49 family peptidase [Spiribacter halobius]PWG63234.1 S49 family peptidase [Spiribacter halobius]UEX76695.1 S49 family peptidase [Spiribacter halobius]